MNDQQFFDAINACRPGSDDLRLPEMADAAARIAHDPAARRLFERTQRADALLSLAMKDVSVPSGAMERVLARLSGNPTVEKPSEQPKEIVSQAVRAATSPHCTSVATRAAKSKAGSGLPWWLITGVLSASLLGVLMMNFWQPSSDPLGPDELLQMAGDWRASALEPSGWSSETESATDNHGNAEYGIPRSLSMVPQRWKRLATKLDPLAVVYDMATPEESAILLFVSHPQTEVAGLPVTPPGIPNSSTGGWAIGFWQTDEALYSLMVQGTADRYQRLIGKTPVLARLRHAASKSLLGAVPINGMLPVNLAP